MKHYSSLHRAELPFRGPFFFSPPSFSSFSVVVFLPSPGQGRLFFPRVVFLLDFPEVFFSLSFFSFPLVAVPSAFFSGRNFCFFFYFGTSSFPPPVAEQIFFNFFFSFPSVSVHAPPPTSSVDCEFSRALFRSVEFGSPPSLRPFPFVL